MADLLDHDARDLYEPGMQTTYFPQSEADHTASFAEGQIVTVNGEDLGEYANRQAKIVSRRDARMLLGE